MKLLSEKATCNSHGQDSSYFLGWQEYEKNPYDEIQNPKGIIQMGLAENQVIRKNTRTISVLLLQIPISDCRLLTFFVLTIIVFSSAAFF